MVASRVGSADIVAQLIEAGAKVNPSAARGQTALMWAAAQRHPDVVKVLLAHGADITARTAAWSQVEAVSPHGRLEYNRDDPVWTGYGADVRGPFGRSRVGEVAACRRREGR